MKGLIAKAEGIIRRKIVLAEQDQGGSSDFWKMKP